MRLNPDAKYPFVDEKDLETLINIDIESVLEELFDMVEVHEPFDCNEALGRTLGHVLEHFDLKIKNVPSNRKCGGYFDMTNRTICVKKVHNNIDNPLFLTIVSHELGHMVQEKSGDMVIYENWGTLSSHFRMEQQCEAIAARLSMGLFGREYVPKYINMETLLFLKNYYKGFIENDMLIKVRKNVRELQPCYMQSV